MTANKSSKKRYENHIKLVFLVFSLAVIRPKIVRDQNRIVMDIQVLLLQFT